jgi:hypothetical protein
MVSVLFCTPMAPPAGYPDVMAMVFARATLPGWVIVLALGAFFAPAGMATTVLLVALGIACLPAFITGGVWKRTTAGDLKVSAYCEAAAFNNGERPAIGDRDPAAIDAEFTVEDVAPADPRRG